MKLKPNVDFKMPICVAYDLSGQRCGMETFAGTSAGAPNNIRFRLARAIETFESIEECELTAAARGQLFLHLKNDSIWIGEDPDLMDFVTKYNPEAVDET